MYQKQILMEKLKEATASVLPISLIVMAISFVLVPVDAGLMLSFVIATAMLILGMGLFTLGADMSMSRIGNYMGSKLTKSRKLPLILTVSFALGVAITVAEPDLQVLAGNVPEIDTTVLILTVSVGVGFFLMLCMVRILFSISLRTMLIVFYAIVFAAAFLSDESILSVAQIATETLPPLPALFQPEHGGGDIVRAAGLLCADAGGLHQRFGQLFRRVSRRRRKLHLFCHPARAIHQ